MASPARPDIAAMQHTLPAPAGPTAVDMQAAAQRAAGKPYIEYAQRRYYFARPVDMFDLASLGEAIDDAETAPVAAIGVINRCLREWLADYPTLVAAFRAEHPATDDAAMAAYGQLAVDMFVALTARPTEAPADSSAGRTSTSTSSKDAPGSPDRAWFPPPSHE